MKSEYYERLDEAQFRMALDDILGKLIYIIKDRVKDQEKYARQRLEIYHLEGAYDRRTLKVPWVLREDGGVKELRRAKKELNKLKQLVRRHPDILDYDRDPWGFPLKTNY